MKTLLSSLKKHTEDELVKLTMAGDEVGYDALMLRHTYRLFLYIYYLMRNHAYAEDLMQDTFLAGLLELRRKNYHDQNDFGKWLRGIARNVAYNWLRERKRERKAMSQLKWNLNTSRTVARRHGISSATLRKAVKSLSPQMQLILSMRFLKKMSFNDIAFTMGITIGAVTSAFSKSLEKLFFKLDTKRWSY